MGLYNHLIQGWALGSWRAWLSCRVLKCLGLICFLAS